MGLEIIELPTSVTRTMEFQLIFERRASRVKLLHDDEYVAYKQKITIIQLIV